MRTVTMTMGSVHWSLTAKNSTSSFICSSRYSSVSKIRHHVPEQRSSAAFRAAAKSSIHGKSMRISAYFSAISRLPSVEPVSAITSSQGAASRSGCSAFMHRSIQRISFLKIIAIDSSGFNIANPPFYLRHMGKTPRSGGFPIRLSLKKTEGGPKSASVYDIAWCC